MVSKVLRILEILHGSSEGLPLKHIAEQTALNKSTAYRFLAHLESEGYVFRDDLGAYTIGLKLIRLGSGATFQATIRKISRPILQKLSRDTGESVNLAILDGQEVLYLDVIESAHSFRLVSQVGMHRPLYCTALGKVLLANLSEEESNQLISSISFERFTPHTLTKPNKLKKELASVRQSGYALDNQEAVLGSRCVAAPIFDETSKAAAAISVSGPVTRVSLEKARIFGAEARKAARVISARFGYSD